MKTFPAYKESDLLFMPFFSVLDLYNRALELETGDIIEPTTSGIAGKIDKSNELTYNVHTQQWE
jgi:hypothetical protein